MTDDDNGYANILEFDNEHVFVVTGPDYRKHAIPVATMHEIIEGLRPFDALPAETLRAVLNDWRHRWINDHNDY